MLITGFSHDAFRVVKKAKPNFARRPVEDGQENRLISVQITSLVLEFFVEAPEQILPRFSRETKKKHFSALPDDDGEQTRQPASNSMFLRAF